MSAALALMTLDDSTGLVELVNGLHAAGIRTTITGIAAQKLSDDGVNIEPLSQLTGGGFGLGEAIDLGHTSLTGGLCVHWDQPQQRVDAASAGLLRLDLLVACLPTDEAMLGDLSGQDHIRWQARAHVLRLAVANPQAVGAVVVQPDDYDRAATALRSGHLSDELRAELRHIAAHHIATFDRLIHAALGVQAQPAEADPDVNSAATQQGLMLTQWPVASTTRIERLHDPSGWLCTLQPIALVSGPLPSAELLLSLDAALQMATWRGDGVAAATAVHGQACAIAVAAAGLPRAIARALGADPVAADGGALACAGVMDITAARSLLRHPRGSVLAAIAVHDITDEALALLKPQADLLIVKVAADGEHGARIRLRPTRFGLLTRSVTGPYAGTAPPLAQLGTHGVSPAHEPMVAMALHACQQLSGQAVVLADGEGSIAICAGQPHTMDGVQVATAKARRVARPCAAVLNGVLSRPQAISALARAKAAVIAVRGLSDQAEAIIEAADKASIALVELPTDWTSEQF